MVLAFQNWCPTAFLHCSEFRRLKLLPKQEKCNSYLLITSNTSICGCAERGFIFLNIVKSTKSFFAQIYVFPWFSKRMRSEFVLQKSYAVHLLPHSCCTNRSIAYWHSHNSFLSRWKPVHVGLRSCSATWIGIVSLCFRVFHSSHAACGTHTTSHAFSHCVCSSTVKIMFHPLKRCCESNSRNQMLCFSVSCMVFIPKIGYTYIFYWSGLGIYLNLLRGSWKWFRNN